MTAAQLHAGTVFRPRNCVVKRAYPDFSLCGSTRVVSFLPRVNFRWTTSPDVIVIAPNSLSVNAQKGFFPSPIVSRRKPVFSRAINQSSSDCDVQWYDVADASLEEEQQHSLSTSPQGLGIDELEKELKKIPSSPSQSQDIRRELVMLSLPAIAGQSIDPLVQLMETAYIGRLGSMELASAGVSITVFNTISKLFNIPLLSVTTSFVAEDISKNAEKEESANGKPFNVTGGRQQLSSVSTALFLAIGIGIFEALTLSFGSGPLLKLMGISSASPMHAAARRFLVLRALGSPAFVVSLALQGIFRGFKDTQTPVFCLGFGNVTAIFLFPLLIYYFQLGVSGAAISTVISQYIVAFSMIYCLNKRAILLPPKFEELQFGDYLKCGGFLIGRTLSLLLTVSLGTSMAARQGPLAMAAHQVCFQVWLAVSMLTDAVAASSQALIASHLSKADYGTVKDLTLFVLKIALFTGVFLAVVLGASFSSLATFFTKDPEVIEIIRTGILFVSGSQPINALAFIFDGLHYGASDFPYAAYSMMFVGVISSAFLLYAPRVFGLPGVWSGLTLFMGLRMVAGFIRIMSKSGPWWFLHTDVKRAEVAG